MWKYFGGFRRQIRIKLAPFYPLWVWRIPPRQQNPSSSVMVPDSCSGAAWMRGRFQNSCSVCCLWGANYKPLSAPSSKKTREAHGKRNAGDCPSFCAPTRPYHCLTPGQVQTIDINSFGDFVSHPVKSVSLCFHKVQVLGRSVLLDLFTVTNANKIRHHAPNTFMAIFGIQGQRSAVVFWSCAPVFNWLLFVFYNGIPICRPSAELPEFR